MPDVVLEAQGLYKKFRKGEIHDSLRDLIPALARRAVTGPLGAQEFWALRDVNFQIERGEAFGVIGNNGAGKSTLLKLLCRILVPTQGALIVKGRLSALIEVGAGFHPDLTGRENVFLNGTILGMTRAEIRSKFDAIVAFSELEEFIDTPVKRYSSGMYARLGFSVAVHVDPDVLIVDEVLSVGDWLFQAKSMDKMRQVMSGGATVVFVSHNLRAVADLCKRVMLIDHGSVAALGPSHEVIKTYMARGSAAMTAVDETKDVYISRVTVKDATGHEAIQFEAPDEMTVEVEVTARRHAKGLAIVIQCLNEQLYDVFNIDERRLGKEGFSIDAGERHITTFAFTVHLVPGAYHFAVHIYRYELEKNFDTRAPAGTFYVRSKTDVRGVADLEPRVIRYGKVGPDEAPRAPGGVRVAND
jgi:lipopolysaccharide transport system ATP-binding protein